MIQRVPYILLLGLPVLAQEPEPTLDWYLPDGIEYDPEVPRPADVLGWEVGEWHVRHDQLVAWYRTLAEASPRFRLETYAHTYEQRPLLLATVSSPDNLARIEELRAAHVEAVRAGAEEHDGPEVLWMGYGVHGNESSASNAALLFAYHLAAARGPEIEAFLEDTVVLIDPCINPDGLNRFANWANSHRGAVLVGDPLHRERREPWPGGRTNHYWFDLNRDWLLLTHPESRGRLERFHAWLPCVLTDYHEMGGDSTYFFQPGIPTRTNPITPERNQELTGAIASYHGRALDELGSLYYTEESFDDFYYGKGSTYPDVNGGVGILFEQASSRGHLRENSYGGLSFPFTIRNQFATSLSTLDAVGGLRAELSAYQRQFFREAREAAAEDPVRAYVLDAPEDPARTAALVDLLRRHAIEVHRLARPIAGFDPATAYLVPTDQAQYRMVRAVFETRTSWPDNTFYDVSSWTLPLSFDVLYEAVERADWSPDLVGARVDEATTPPGEVAEAERPVAWILEWHHRAAARNLARLLDAGVRARVATRTFHSETTEGTRSFDLGAVVVPTGVQDVEAEELMGLLTRAAEEGLTVHAATSGLTPEGIDLGSGSLRELEAPRPALVVGDGVSGYEAGEVWHHLDQRLGVGLPLIERDDLDRLDLTRHTHLLLVSGATSGWSESTADRVRRWVRDGGVLIATRRAASWAESEYLTRIDTDGEDQEEDEVPEPLPYQDYRELRAEQRVAGTIFETTVDRTHPLCYGLTRERLPVFRNSDAVLAHGRDPFASPVRYTEEPLLSGFASASNVERIAGTPAVRARRVGGGVVIAMIDDPLFRGVWRGTSRLYENALFFGGAIRSTGPLRAGATGADDGHGHGHGHDYDHDHGHDH